MAEDTRKLKSCGFRAAKAMMPPKDPDPYWITTIPTWARPLEPACPPAAPADEDCLGHQQTVYPSTVDRPTTWHCNL
eukprot:8976090-Pyramimonas_sp.AAC.1